MKSNEVRDSYRYVKHFKANACLPVLLTFYFWRNYKTFLSAMLKLCSIHMWQLSSIAQQCPCNARYPKALPQSDGIKGEVFT